MSMDTDSRRTMADRLSAAAEGRTCTVCDRRGALVTVDLGDRTVTYCKWQPQGKCSFAGTASDATHFGSNVDSDA